MSISSTSYQITCTKCQNSAEIKVQETNLAPPNGVRIEWIKQTLTNKGVRGPISARQRLDGTLGFECTCKNNSLMTGQERKKIKHPQAPQPQELAEIIKNLKKTPELDTPHGKLVEGFLIKQG